jgi:hypothetical protein
MRLIGGWAMKLHYVVEGLRAAGGSGPVLAESARLYCRLQREAVDDLTRQIRMLTGERLDDGRYRHCALEAALADLDAAEAELAEAEAWLIPAAVGRVA